MGDLGLRREQIVPMIGKAAEFAGSKNDIRKVKSLMSRCGLITNSIVNTNRPLSFRVPPPRWEITYLDYSDPNKTYPLILKRKKKRSTPTL